MQVTPTDLPGMLLIEPRVFGDARGSFKETYHQQRYAEAGMPLPFVQDNLSRSQQGTLRGLHVQVERSQGKLVQAFEGEIFDVAVDVRPDSPTFGQWAGARLSAENHLQLYIPPGFAHGFYVLSETALVFYKCTDVYCPEHERTLAWNDLTVGIKWPTTEDLLLSEKDQHGRALADFR